ncbi:hypothetical protein MN116_005870 [Schistosoma mekongi]|uniref:Spp2/MOS2 G-patch domain-containing protein n=1 Tax=Schistosoma mekongi TaxID=38744 RepID=A0AAE2D3N9_SCHME|nr:hypothetical protein MN116_005870 [Schistosoma mekongi]
MLNLTNDLVGCSASQKEEEIIIPLKRSKSSFRERLRSNFVSSESLDALTLQALKEIKEESQASFCDSYNNRMNCDVKIPCSSGVIEETEDANYDAVPIEKFGIALLSGMGFDPKSVDTSKKDALYPQRPRGLGLGANPTAIQVAKQDLLNSKAEDLTWTPGACCQVILGKNKGLYGKLEGMDGNTGRVVIRLKVSKEAVTVLQHNVRLVPSKEYAAYSNCINQIEVDEYKAHETEQLLRKSHCNLESDLSTSRSNRIEKSTHNDSSRAASKILEDNGQLKCEPNRSSSSTAWLRPKLIVRCLDRNYCGGKYNGEKLIIVSVDANRCSCKTESGQIIKDFPANHLQTVIPYEMNSILMIVKGERNGQLARLIKRDGRNQVVDVKTRSGIPLQYRFDCLARLIKRDGRNQVVDVKTRSGIPLQYRFDCTDSGYGWIIVISSFIIQMIIDGTFGGFGVLYLFLQNDQAFISENYSQTILSMPGTIQPGFFLCTGAFVSPLIQIFGFRISGCFGALLLGLGMSVSSYLTNIHTFTLFYGIISGSAFGILMVCAIVSVNYYFDRYRGLASGTAMSGSGVGTLIVPVLYNWIIPIKGWRFCLLLYSLSASLLTALASLTFKPFISNDLSDDPELTEQSAITDSIKEAALDRTLILKTVPEKLCTEEDVLTPPTEKNHNKTDDLTIYSTNNKLDDNAYDSNPKRERKFSIGFTNALRQYLLNSKESATLPEVNNDTEDAESMVGSRLWKSSQGFKRHRPSETSHQKRPCQFSHFDERQKQNCIKFPRKTTWTTASAVHDHIHSSYNLSSVRNPRRKQFTSQAYNIFDKPDAFYSASLTNLNRKTTHLSNGHEKSDNSSIYVSGNVKYPMSSKSSLIISPKTANKNKSTNELIDSNASFQLFPITAVNQHQEQQQQQIRQEQFLSVDNPVHKSSRCNIYPEFSIIDKSIPEEKIMTIPNTDESYTPTSTSSVNKFKQYLTVFGYGIIKLFDLSLFIETSFLYLIGIGITSQLAYFIPFVYLIDCAVSYGMEQNHAVLIVMILSILHTIGRLLSGIMSNVFHLDSVYLSGLATFVGGLAHLFLVFIIPHTFTWYAVYASIYGLCSGIPIPLIPILLVRFSGLERLTASFSNLNLLKGIASMVGPTVAVSIVEYTSQKDHCFLVAGICYIISALLHLGLCRHSCFKKYSKSNTSKQNAIDYDDEDNFDDPYAKCCSCY